MTCQWLMGECEVNDVEIDGGRMGAGHGVLVKRCASRGGGRAATQALGSSCLPSAPWPCLFTSPACPLAAVCPPDGPCPRPCPRPPCMWGALSCCGLCPRRCRYLEEAACASVCINSCKVRCRRSRVPRAAACRSGPAANRWQDGC